MRHGSQTSGAPEAWLDEEWLLLSTFQSLPKTSVVPKLERPSESHGELLKSQLPRARSFLADSEFLGLHILR